MSTAQNSEENSILLEELSLLVEEGIYPDRKALVQDALRTLLRSKPELRHRLALSLYKRDNVSLTRAAEIAGLDLESFKELLHEAGVVRRISPVGEGMEPEVKHLLEIRGSEASR